MKYFLIIIVLLISFESYTQEISVELSIEWKKEKENNWKKYKLNKTPFLNIKYTNTTDNNIYIKKRINYINFGITWIECRFNGEKAPKFSYKKLGKYDNEKYFIDLSLKDFSQYMNVVSEKERLNTDFDYSQAYINKPLMDIYENLYKVKTPYLDEKFELIKNKIEVNIKGSLKNYFLFLKKGESHIDSFDLTGFNILGGTYTFKLSTDELCDYVLTTSFWNETEKKWDFKKEYLPLKIDEYQLYSGKIKTNEITVAFKSIKAKE